MTRIGIFGGAFNPPHIGHLAAARFFQQAIPLDDLIIVPTYQSPLKERAACVPDQARLELCRLTFPFPVSDLELARGGTSYTIDTLRQIRAQYPRAELYLLIGTDQLAQFTSWRAWQDILRLCTVCALQRDAAPLHTALPVKLLSGFTPIEVSSTQLRGALARGEDVSQWLTPAAYAYIKKKLLYEQPPLPPDRLHHSRCVAESAEALALQYGANPEKARVAGLWHDCAKYFSFEKKARLAAAYGKPFTDDEYRCPQICHAFAGEAWLALEKGVTDEEILSAVRWHTTGHPGMTLPEEIVFVADLISADRDYPDVETVRALAASNLHAASKYILAYIIDKCTRQGRPIHPATLAWYEELGGTYAAT